MIPRRLGLLGLALATPLDALLVPELGETQVNSVTDLVQAQPAVAAAPDGRFVVVWQSATSAGDDSSDFSIQARRFDADGAPLSGQVQVNETAAGFQAQPELSADGAGGFLAAWGSEEDPGGGFLVVWQSDVSAGGDIASRSIQGQLHDAAGSLVGSQFQVNDFEDNPQDAPVVAVARALGRLVAAWESTGSSGDDDSLLSVQARSWLDGGLLFGDGFESGDSCRWTATVPPPGCP